MKLTIQLRLTLYDILLALHFYTFIVRFTRTTKTVK